MGLEKEGESDAAKFGLGEDKSKLVEGLMEVLGKLKELEKNPPTPKEPVKNEKVEEAVKAFESSMKSGAAEEVALEEDELNACATMATRRYTGSIDGRVAKEARSLLERLAEEPPTLSAGEASKTAVFKSIAV